MNGTGRVCTTVCMSDVVATAFSGKAFEALWETAIVGGIVTIFLGGLKVHSFAEAEPVERDMVVWSLVTVGLMVRTVARLCGVSTGHVVGVKHRVSEGGLYAFRPFRRRGTPTPRRSAATLPQNWGRVPERAERDAMRRFRNGGGVARTVQSTFRSSPSPNFGGGSRRCGAGWGRAAAARGDPD